jgi:hypothetical protein
MRRNLYFSGNGMYTDQLVSVASYRAQLSSAPAAPIASIHDDQPRPLPPKPMKAEMQKLQRENESLKRQLGQVQPTPKGATLPEASSIMRSFTSAVL